MRKKTGRAAFLGCALTLLATPSVACPWHALVGQLDALGPESNAKRVLIIQQINHMTSEESTFRGGAQKVALPAHYGFSCSVEPAAATPDNDRYVLTCERQGVRETVEHSCSGPEARTIKAWDGLDRMGVNVLSTLLICLPPELIPAGV